MAVIGTDGPAVLLSAETAYYLERCCKVAALRQRLRDGQHTRVSKELLDLRRVAMDFDPARLPHGTEVGSDFAEATTGLTYVDWLSVAETADLLDIGTRAVRLACSEDRLDAERVGGRWRISRQALEEFKAARAA